MKEISSTTIAEMAALFTESETESTKGNMSDIARMESHLQSTADILNRLVSLNASQAALRRVLTFYAMDSQDKDKRDVVRTLIGNNGIFSLLDHIEASHHEINVIGGVLEALSKE